MIVRKDVVVLGAGGHGKVVVAMLQAAGFTVSGVYDDDPSKWGQKVLGVPVLGSTHLLARGGAWSAVLAIGDNRVRSEVANRLGEVCNWISVVHPQAYVHPSVRLGRGTVVFAGAVIQPDAVLGDHCIVNTGATIDHDCAIGSFSHVAPGAHLAGGVRIGTGTLIGVGSALVPGVSVGDWSVVGAGAVVIRDVPDRTTVVGVPARPVREEQR